MNACLCMLSLNASLLPPFEVVFKNCLIICFHSVHLKIFCCQQQLHKTFSFWDFYSKVWVGIMSAVVVWHWWIFSLFVVVNSLFSLQIFSALSQCGFFSGLQNETAIPSSPFFSYIHNNMISRCFQYLILWMVNSLYHCILPEALFLCSLHHFSLLSLTPLPLIGQIFRPWGMFTNQSKDQIFLYLLLICLSFSSRSPSLVYSQ